MIDILIPTYRRPERIAPLIKNIEACTPEPHRVVFICDEGDSLREAFRRGAVGVMNEHAKSYAGAINTGVEWSSAEWVFFGADDLEFTPGWLAALGSKMAKPWCVVGTNDMDWDACMSGETATHVLVRRDYIMQHGGTADHVPGVALNEDYRHYCVEQELIQVAKQRVVWTPCLESVVIHKPERVDEKAAMNEQRRAEDKRLYDSRKPLWKNRGYAQYGEDVHLDVLLGQKKDGFYVDVGACDPVRSSVTKLFYDRGWRGVNIDASPRWHNELRAARPRDVNVHALVGNGGYADFHIVGNGSAADSTNPANVAAYSNVTKVRMKYTPLSEILAGVGEIDFLKVDAEGSERGVLESNDWTKHGPRFLCIEATKPYTNIPCHQDWEDVVVGAGYHFVRRVGHDRIYERNI